MLDVLKNTYSLPYFVYALVTGSLHELDGLLFVHGWCPRQESNLQLTLRRGP